MKLEMTIKQCEKMLQNRLYEFTGKKFQLQVGKDPDSNEGIWVKFVGINILSPSDFKLLERFSIYPEEIYHTPTVLIEQMLGFTEEDDPMLNYWCDGETVIISLEK